MKKIIVAMSMLLAIGSTTAFATETPANTNLERTFQKEFSGAQHVSWTTEEGYDKAVFVLGGSRVMAWFDTDGDLAGTVRDLAYNQLPLTVMRAIDKKFGPSATFIDLRELTNGDGTRYKLTIESGEKKYNVSVYANGNIDDVSKVRK